MQSCLSHVSGINPPTSICMSVVEKCYRVTLIKCPPAFTSRLGDVKLYIRGRSLCLATCGSSSSPPTYLASWNISGLRRFGVLDDRFCFDAGECNGSYALPSASGVIYFLNSVCGTLNVFVECHNTTDTRLSADCPPNSAVNRRRPGFSGCCLSCLERSATVRHGCRISACLLQSPQDSSL